MPHNLNMLSYNNLQFFSLSTGLNKSQSDMTPYNMLYYLGDIGALHDTGLSTHNYVNQ